MCVLPEQLFLFELQLQHHGVELHVQIVGSLQLSLVVFSDVKSMPVKINQTDVKLSKVTLQMPSFISSRTVKIQLLCE